MSRSRIRSSTASFASCSARVPGSKSATVAISATTFPFGSSASFSRICALTAAVCSGRSASIMAPATFIFPPKTFSAFTDHSPAPPFFEPFEPRRAKLYSHGSAR